MKMRTSQIIIAITLLCLVAAEPKARAVVPAPDGGYPGGNTAEGQNALLSLTTGGFNTAVGFFSLRSDTTGSFNTAIGAGTLLANTAAANTAVGTAALLSNTTGADNTANGAFALFSNTTGASNTAIGRQALISNTTGSSNTANGFQALYFNTGGGSNVANGYAALAFNTTGVRNTANGYEALFSNADGNYNTADGDEALFNNTAGQANIAVGFRAGDNITGDFNIDIGNNGVAGESNTIRIGNQAIQTTTYIAGIYGATASGGAAVYINSVGQLGTATSSQRYKQDIHPMDKASEAILGLLPVTFHYKRELDPAGIPQLGLVAEQVEKVNPDLVTRDEKGKPYTVRYEAVNAMLLNEFLKEHRTVQELKTTVAQQKQQIDALTAGLQKVSARLEADSRPAQMVSNNR